MKTKLRPCKTCTHDTVQVKIKAQMSYSIDNADLWYCPVCGTYWMDQEETKKTTVSVQAYRSCSGEHYLVDTRRD